MTPVYPNSPGSQNPSPPPPDHHRHRPPWLPPPLTRDPPHRPPRYHPRECVGCVTAEFAATQRLRETGLHQHTRRNRGLPCHAGRGEASLSKYPSPNLLWPQNLPSHPVRFRGCLAPTHPGRSFDRINRIPPLTLSCESCQVHACHCYGHELSSSLPPTLRAFASFVSIPVAYPRASRFRRTVLIFG